MKELRTFLESKDKFEIKLLLNDVRSDLYNVLSTLFFKYYQNGNDIDKKEYEDAIAFFNDKFFKETEEE